jgi:uncharacterized protein (TIGR02118 family)
VYKTIFAITFKEDKDASLEHWLGTHAKLIVELPGVVKYVQNEMIEKQGDTGFDGLAELYFRDENAYKEAMESDQWNDVVQPDGDNFVVWDETSGAIMREHHVK